MDKKWSKKFSCCLNCRTIRFKHVAKGYCTRCYRLVKRLAEINKWDFHDATTLIGYPQNQSYKSPFQFESIKSQYQKQIEKRLFSLWAKEEKLNNFVSGIDIEYILNRLAKRCRTRTTDIYKGTAEMIDDNFSADQRKIMFRLLNHIEENLHVRIKIISCPN